MMSITQQGSERSPKSEDSKFDSPNYPPNYARGMTLQDDGKQGNSNEVFIVI